MCQTRCCRNLILSLMVADEIAQHESQRKHNDKSNKTPSCFKEEWLDQVVQNGNKTGTKTMKKVYGVTS